MYHWYILYIHTYAYVQAPVLLLTMANVAVYAYAQPYQKRYINILEVVILVDVLLLLMILSTKVIDKFH